ncbi:MAG: branched-chain amino acid ABC transporter permease [Verrucomicrobiota bacterium]
MQFGIGLLIDSITAIAFTFLLACGLYVVYGLLRVINLAHGDLMLVGAYSASVLQESGAAFIVCVGGAAAAPAMLGGAMEFLLIRRLYDRDDLSTLLVTAGIGLCLRECIRLVFGPAGRFVDAPTAGLIDISGVPYSTYSLVLTLSAAAVATASYLLVRFTRIGLIVRASMEDPTLAESAGISRRRTCRWAFAVGAALAGLAGALVAPVSSVNPYMGLEWSVAAFVVVIICGAAQPSPMPLLYSAAVIAGGKTVLNAFLGMTSATIGSLLIVILILLVRPDGLAIRR